MALLLMLFSEEALLFGGERVRSTELVFLFHAQALVLQLLVLEQVALERFSLLLRKTGSVVLLRLKCSLVLLLLIGKTLSLLEL